MNNENLNLQKTTVFHLNTIGALIIFISLPDELYDDPKSMKFFHKCENNQIEIRIKGKNGKLLLDYKYNFKNNSLSVINIKETLPKIISLFSKENDNKIKYLNIKYSITKSAINDYFFSDKILNFDTLYDYLEKKIEKKLQKDFKKLKLNSLFCKNCKQNYLIQPKEIIFDYDAVRIEQNFEEFFNCKNNFDSFMKNSQATEGIENLKKTYEIKYNLDNLYLWIFDKYLDNEDNNENKMDIINDEDKLILCQNCKEIIGKKEEYCSILFNKIFFNSTNLNLIIDNNEQLPFDIDNIFNKVKQSEIVFETKMNIIGLLNKDNDNEFINENNTFFIDNYINMFEVVCKNINENEIKEDLVEQIFLSEQDFIKLETIIEENIKIYLNEFFFYKLLTNENKKYYCFSFPKKL